MTENGYVGREIYDKFPPFYRFVSPRYRFKCVIDNSIRQFRFKQIDRQQYLVTFKLKVHAELSIIIIDGRYYTNYAYIELKILQDNHVFQQETRTKGIPTQSSI